MPSSSHLASMFHRRLALLVVVISLGMAALAAQLVRLTVAQGADLRAQAEAKLVNLVWSYAGRGRILDRKGRVLAQDRPSFDLTVDYRVISGEWAGEQALALAREQNRDTWRKIGRQERQALADPYIPVFQEHVERMWSKIGAETGTSRARIRERTDEIESRVQALSSWMYRARLGGVLRARLAAGDEISGELDEQTRRRLERPIEDAQSPQVVLAKIPDESGFNLIALSGIKTELSVPLPDGGSVMKVVPLMPGMAVVAAGDREYPMDAIEVDADLSSLPEPVKATQGIDPLAKAVKKTILVEGVAYHILGRMKPKAQKEDNDRREERIRTDPAFAARVRVAPLSTPWLTGHGATPDRGRYADGDPAGLSGIEASQEDELRGLRGLKVKQLETGDEREILPDSGHDVRLTLDIALQARVQAVMSPAMGLAVAQEWHGKENPTIPIGTPLNGAAVVLDIDSGEILAMVSTPTISRAVLKENPGAIFGDQMNLQAGMPWIDRAIARPYPPGSIAKAMILNGAVKFGKLNLDSPIDCTGHLYPDRPDMFRCWIYKNKVFNTTHTAVFGHALSAPEALMVSCNIYFFTLGQRLGPRGITDTYTMFGLGQPWGLGIGLEYEGTIGEPAKGGGTLPLGVSDATQMGIGQGPVSWTPLHAADAYATLARGGVRITPHILAGVGSPETMDLGLDPRAVRQAMEGLKKSVSETLGTGHHLSINGRQTPHFNIPGTVVWGKTGTAQAPTIYVEATMPDPDHPGQEISNPLWDRGVDAATIISASGDQSVRLPSGKRALRWGDHSWFVVLVGDKAEGRPRYAISVIMEYAGSGGKVSGPIVNQIIAALRAEGYL